MLLSYNISKLSNGLHKCRLKSFSTSTKQLKWPKLLKPSIIPKYDKPKPVKIWKNMTIWDLAKSLKKDLEFIDNVLKPALENKYDKSYGTIEDLQVVRTFLKKENLNFIVTDPVIDPMLSKKGGKKVILSIPDYGVEGNEVKRPPVVTIMGHVDHGKTSLLDALRNSNIVDHEFGGITQHIGAFSVSLTPGNTVTFIDTPGHKAFSAMRNRGVQITDIVVLIVAADDGVMEQTIESIKMAKNSGANIIVAVNKIDKAPIENVIKIKQQLLEEGIQAEDLGGDVQVIPVSALKRQNLDKLIEAVLLEADMMGLTGDPNGPFEGVVVESFMGKSGKLATVIVKRGTLRKRTIILAGQALARVRAMYNENGVELSEVTLSQPAQISGWRDLPKAGDKIIEVKKESDARELIRRQKEEEMHSKLLKDYQKIQENAVQASSDNFQRKNYLSALIKVQDIEGLKQMFMKKQGYIAERRVKLDIMIKGDVHGSVDAIMNVVNTYNCSEQCALKVIHSEVGKITVSDIELAEVFDATIYCFNIPFPEELKSVIAEKRIRLKFFNVIYKFIDDLIEEINTLLPNEEKEVTVGIAEVLQNFTITDNKKKIPTAGCLCVSGELRKGLLYRVFRNDNVLYEGKIKSLKHFKNEVNSIKKDSQCGIMFQDFIKEFHVGDKIICFQKETYKPQINWNPGF